MFWTFSMKRSSFTWSLLFVPSSIVHNATINPLGAPTLVNISHPDDVRNRRTQVNRKLPRTFIPFSFSFIELSGKIHSVNMYNFFCYLGELAFSSRHLFCALLLYKWDSSVSLDYFSADIRTLQQNHVCSSSARIWPENYWWRKLDRAGLNTTRLPKLWANFRDRVQQRGRQSLVATGRLLFRCFTFRFEFPANSSCRCADRLFAVAPRTATVRESN